MKTNDAANRRYGLGPAMNDGLPVACWCEKACKPMTPQQVRDGHGWSCGTDCYDRKASDD